MLLLHNYERMETQIAFPIDKEIKEALYKKLKAQ